MDKNTQRSHEPVVAGPFGRFYGENGGTSREEAKRLGEMAKIADRISLGAMGEYAGRVVDVGCGDSTSLGRAIASRGGRYVPLDLGRGPVETQIAHGFPAEQCFSTQLPVSDGEFTCAHSRFVFGWLSDDARKASLSEMIRAVKPGGRVVVIDYNWSSVDGPDFFKDAVSKVAKAMEAVGFEPSYGEKSPNFVRERLNEFYDNVPGGIDLEISGSPAFEGGISDGLEILRQNVNAFVEQMKKLGISEVAEEIEKVFKEAEGFAYTEPNTPIRLPDIVSVAFINPGSEFYGHELKEMHSRSRERNSSREKTEEPLVEGRDYVLVASVSGVVGFEDVIKPTSPLGDVEIAKSKAWAYYADGNVTLEAIGKDGTLVGEVSPPDVEERTEKFAVYDGKNIKGSVGYIKPKALGAIDSQLGSLPTIGKIFEQSPVAEEFIRAHQLVEDPSKVIEITSLAKDPFRGSFDDVVRSVLAMSEDAYSEGYEWAVIGLSSKRAGLIKNIFGEALKVIPVGDSSIKVGKGGKLIGEGVELVPMLVEVKTFTEEVNKHAKNMLAQQPNGGMFESISFLTDRILAKREKVAAA